MEYIQVTVSADKRFRRAQDGGISLSQTAGFHISVHNREKTVEAIRQRFTGGVAEPVFQAATTAEDEVYIAFTPSKECRTVQVAAEIVRMFIHESCGPIVTS